MFDIQSDDVDFEVLLSDISSDTFSTTSEEAVSVDSNELPKIEYDVNETSASSYIIKRPRRNRNDPFPLPEWKAFAATKPTIMKSDIRRSYCAMLANVLNSGELSLLFGFLDTFFVPNFKQSMVKQSPVTREPYTVVVSGSEAVATLWYSMINLNPDPVVSISDTKVHLVSNSNCTKIVSEYSFSATCIYEHQMLPCVDEQGNNTTSAAAAVTSAAAALPQSAFNQPLVGRKRKCSGSGDSAARGGQTTEADRVDMHRSIEGAVEAMKASLPLRAAPLAIRTAGKVVLHTDENKFIRLLEMDMLDQGK